MAARRIPDPKVGGSNPSGLIYFCVLSFYPEGLGSPIKPVPLPVPLYAFFKDTKATYLAGA